MVFRGKSAGKVMADRDAAARGGGEPRREADVESRAARLAEIVAALEAAIPAAAMSAMASWAPLRARWRSLIAESLIPTTVTTPDGRYVAVNPAMCDFVGLSAEELLKRTWLDLIPAGDREANARIVADMLTDSTKTFRGVQQFLHKEGRVIWADVSVFVLRDAAGRPEFLVGQANDINDLVEARRAIERYQRIIETSPVAMALHTLDGAVVSVNAAMCQLFGVDAETLLRTDWHTITPAESLQGNLRVIEDLSAGWLDSYRDTQRFFRADGYPFWVDVTVSCLRGADGKPEYIYSQMLDITARIEAQQRQQSELDSAAEFLRAILPGDLTGPVRVSSRYRSSREVGGDCYDYAWIDDDHLAVYLLDVSGHGVQPAMVAVSVLDGLRARSLPADILLAPDRVLAELNGRFGMEDHNEHYLTIFYGVYERSTRTLTYAGAGHPPALVLGGAEPVLLASQSPPLGMFADTEFAADRYRVPAGAQVLLYSDGIYEFSRPDGSQLIPTDFAKQCAATASTPGWSLDSLITQMQFLSATGEFDDDCSLVLLSPD